MVHSLSLSDGGKSKIAIRFDEQDGILKYYKEFGFIVCSFEGPPDTPYKVKLIDNTRKEICSGGSVLIINQQEKLATDRNGSSTFTCVISKGCQAYESMFFILSITWNSSTSQTNPHPK